MIKTSKVFTVLVGMLALGHVVRAGEVIYGYENPSANKFKNWDFESNLSNNDWVPYQATVTKVSGGHTGGSSIKVENRKVADGSVKQVVKGLNTNTNYYVSFFVKMTKNANAGLGYATFFIMCKSGSVVTKVAKSPFLLVDNRWKHIGGDYRLSSGSSAECWVKAKPNEVNFQLDSASFIELKKRSNWKSYLDSKIKQVRTSTIRVWGRLPSGCSASSTTIKVELKRHEFGFGTAIKAKEFVGTNSVQVNYRNFILKHFNWAVLENAMKWRQMEATKGRIIYEHVDKALAVLKKHNFTIRGHTMLWENKGYNPDWVQRLTGNNLKNAIMNRITYLMKRYKNDIAEWDVCNEYLHGHFYESATGDRDLLSKEFAKAYSLHSGAKLFLNDFEIMKNGRQAASMANLAEDLKRKNVHVSGIGLQSHMRILPVDEEVLEKRLQVASRLNLPVTITEFTVHSSNVNTRAEALDMAFRVYFANPKVKAILLWGFTDQFPTFANDFFLVNGRNFSPNAAGQKLLHLIHEEWSTKKDIKPSSNNVDTTIKQAFRGQYKLTTICNGQVKAEKEFYLGNGQATVSP